MVIWHIIPERFHGLLSRLRDIPVLVSGARRMLESRPDGAFR